MSVLWRYFDKLLGYVLSPIFLFVLALVILVVYVLCAKSNFFNLKRILTDYKATFSGAERHLLIFWGVPALLAGSLVQVALIKEDIADNILVFLSILIAGFFSILAILVTQQGFSNKSPLYKQVLDESATIVLLEIILCIFALIITIACPIYSEFRPAIFHKIISFLYYY